MPDSLSTLGNLFENQKLRLRIAQLARLQQPVGDDPVRDLPSLHRTGSGAKLTLLGQPFEATGELAARVELLGNDAAVDPFGTGLEAPLAVGDNPGLLTVGAAFGVSADTGPDLSSTQLSARAGASGSVVYRHWLPFEPTKPKLGNALGLLVSRSRLPNRLLLDAPLHRGEVHALEAKLRLDFGIEVQKGFKVEQELLSSLSEGLSKPFKFNAEASLRAALGLSLYDQMSIVVGRAHTENNGWLRIRIQRTDERRLSFTATFNLDLEYDFGTALVQLFEEMTDQIPVPRLVQTAETITSTLAEGDWDGVKERLTGEMEEVLDDLVSEVLELATGEDQDWREWLDDDPRIAAITGFASQVVAFHGGLDARAESLWRRLVAKADLGPGSEVREWLERLAGLEDQDLDAEAFLGGDAAELVAAIEAISGRSLEEIVLDNEPDLSETLADVSKVASDILDLLTDTPSDVLAKIKEFAEKTGIARTVDALRQIDSKEDLETAVSTRIRNFAGRLVDKAWDKLTQSDLEAVQGWAAKVHQWLPDPSADGTKAKALTDRIKAELEKVKLDYGLSIGVEIERVSRSTALLDFEIDAGDTGSKLRGQIAEHLKLGRVQDILETLADAADTTESKGRRIDMGKEAPSPPYLLHECVFTSERIRTEALGISFSLVGLGLNFNTKERGFNRRIEQSTVRVAPPPDGGAPVRTGTYVGAYQRGDAISDYDNEGGVWLVSKLRSADISPRAPYEETLERYLRLTFTWESERIDETEIEGLSKLLSDLGFQPASPNATLLRHMVIPEDHVRLAYEIRFPEDVLRAFFGGSWNGSTTAERRWNRAFLNAASRWFGERYVQRSRISNSDWSLGHTLARVITGQDFRNDWLSVGGFFSEHGGGSFEIIRPPEPTLAIPIGDQDDWTDITGPIISMMMKRQRGWKAVRRFRKTWATASDPNALSPADQVELSEEFADFWKRASLYTLRWPDSMGAQWLWIALLAAVDEDLLPQAQGIAVLRRRKTAAQEPNDTGGGSTTPEWEPPEFWTLPSGIPKSQPGVFPI